MAELFRRAKAFLLRAATWGLAALRSLLFALRGAMDTLIPAAGAWILDHGPQRLLARLAASPWVRVPILTALIAGLAVTLIRASSLRVPPGKIGVRQIDFGRDAGIVERDYSSGLQRSFRAWETWHLLDARTEFLRFAWKSEGGHRGAIEARTQDGNTIQIAASVPFRIRPGAAHRIVAGGLQATYKKQVESLVRATVLQEAAKWRSEQLYATEARERFSRNALTTINEGLEPLHVVADGVHLAGVWFPPVYEKKLQEQQLESQAALTKDAQNRLEDASYESTRVESEIKRAESRQRLAAAAERERERRRVALEIARLERETKQTIELQRARTEAEVMRLKSASALLLEQADAREQRLRAKVMQSPGGRYLLAREAASKLRFERITLDSRAPARLDLNALVENLVGE